MNVRYVVVGSFFRVSMHNIYFGLIFRFRKFVHVGGVTMRIFKSMFSKICNP
ncbi:hypothetical protein DSUL_20357 [Desulfovibrionales bacterium]